MFYSMGFCWIRKNTTPVLLRITDSGAAEPQYPRLWESGRSPDPLKPVEKNMFFVGLEYNMFDLTGFSWIRNNTGPCWYPPNTSQNPFPAVRAGNTAQYPSFRRFTPELPPEIPPHFSGAARREHSVHIPFSAIRAVKH